MKRERYTDDHRAGMQEKLYSQWELGSEKSTESTPYPRLNRAAELASFWDPQNDRNQRGEHAAVRMPRKPNVGRHCRLAYVIDGDILSYGNRCSS
jgi:hypothetical protein